jgi:hypothetical protein
VVRIEEAVSSTRLRSRPPPCFRMGMGLGGELLRFSSFLFLFLVFPSTFSSRRQQTHPYLLLLKKVHSHDLGEGYNSIVEAT